jgi:CO/xanthine dehydrogenase Mo-binding subunit
MKNGFEAGAVTATGQKLTHIVSLKEVLTKAVNTVDFEKKWNQYRHVKSGEKRRGVGLACSYRGVSLGAEGTDAAETIVSVQTDGSVIVSSGITDMGQGAQTQMSQITAEVLGVSMNRIQFLNTNTSRVADSGATVASRGTIMGGSAAKKAAEQVRGTFLEVGAEMTGDAVSDLDLFDNYLINIKTKKRLASFNELATTCFNKGRSMIGLGWHHSPKTSWDEKQGQGEAYFTFVYGANATEVEVDIETGKVNVMDFISVHDVGKAINKGMVEAQIYGGVAMGIGMDYWKNLKLKTAFQNNSTSTNI